MRERIQRSALRVRSTSRLFAHKHTSIAELLVPVAALRHGGRQWASWDFEATNRG
jgi:hypothetical protein